MLLVNKHMNTHSLTGLWGNAHRSLMITALKALGPLRDKDEDYNTQAGRGGGRRAFLHASAGKVSRDAFGG